MSYLTNISEHSYLYNTKFKIITPYDEFISSNINFELFAILEFIINSYMPFGLILTKRPSIFKMFTSDKNFCLLVPQSKVTKLIDSGFLYDFIDERNHIKRYGMLEFSSSFEILISKFILSYLPKFKTIKELYLKTKLSGKPIPYRIDKMVKHFKEESNKLIEDYDAPF
jgi:hypothetical protein